MIFKTFDSLLLLPVLYYSVSVTSFFICIQLPTRARLFTATLIYFFAILSLNTSAHLSWFYQGAASYWNLMICIYMHHTFSVLFIDGFKFPCEPLSQQGWLLAYKIWADPQHQLDWSTYMQTRDRRLVGTKTYALFAFRRILKIALCWYFELRILNPVIGSYFQFAAEDFAPEYEPIVRRLIVQYPSAPISSRELQIRAVISTYWIWLAYLLLDGANVLLSLCFVCVMRLDRPEEWKPLFGSITSASSLRGFWGKLWHRLAAPSCASSARLILRSCSGLQPHSGSGKRFIAFWTFFVSGIIHAAAEWQAKEPVFPGRQLQFWLTNFAAAALETYVIGIWRRGQKTSEQGCIGIRRLFLKIIGYAWVFLFFFWIVPKWQYPKLFAILTPGVVSYNNNQPTLFLDLLLAEQESGLE